MVGNVLVSVERSIDQRPHRDAVDRDPDGWRDVGIGATSCAPPWTGRASSGLAKLALGVFPDNERAIAVYEHTGFVREGAAPAPVPRPADGYRDEVLMAWFPTRRPPMTAACAARARASTPGRTSTTAIGRPIRRSCSR